MKKITYYIIGSCLLFFTGCSNWLEVNPKDKIEEKEMFSSENGFKNALTGAYIKLKSENLYGRGLTMEFTENLAQHWVTNPQNVDGYTNTYNYENKEVQQLIKDVYGELYNIVVNVNNLLDFVDNGVLTSDMHDLIKGEALAMRAFCHLDLLRLFGPIPGQQNKSKMLSYVRTISLQSQQVNTYDEYVGFLEKDLNDAEALLKEVDKKGIKDDFYSYRENRLNYWAVLALKARFYLWVQNKPKAAEYANQVIVNSGLRLNQGEDFAVKNYIASPEHLFALHAYNLENIVNAYFFREGTTKQDQTKIKKDIFENDVTDFRGKYLWQEFSEKAGVRYTTIKYQQNEVAAENLQLIPLIRLYEMYLIAIECSDDEAVYKPLIDELVSARNISVLNLGSVEKKNEFVAKEYQKEFYAEGQQFFQCKRRGDKEILWTDKVGGKDIYVLPLPKGEIQFE